MQAQSPLSGVVTVERQTIAIDASLTNARRDSTEEENGLSPRTRPVRSQRDKLLASFEAELGQLASPVSFFISPGSSDFSSWQVYGRVTPEGAGYVALPMNWRLQAENLDEIPSCTVRFDTVKTPSDVELDHFLTLFTVLAAGDCSTRRLDDDELRAGLDYPADPVDFSIRAEREFVGGGEVKVVVADEFKWITDWRSVLEKHLGSSEFRQSLSLDNSFLIRGFVETVSGELVFFLQDKDFAPALCVYRRVEMREILGISYGAMVHLRDSTPQFQRYCIDQLKALKEEHSQILRADRRPFETSPVEH